MIYVLDSNIVIRYLRNDKNVLKYFDAAALRGDILIVPKAADYEIRRGFRIANAPAKKAAYHILIESADFCAVGDMDGRSWTRAEAVYAELYEKGFTVGEIDILIAAYCLERGAVLVTNNTKDFVNIGGLQCVDWAKEQSAAGPPFERWMP